jgi:predicted AlkP superfamily pyrophosphatase or phosphodiesterase
MQCWRKAAMPAALHYGRNPRVPPFVCLAEPGWMIWDRAPATAIQLGGMHGYDPAAPDMAAAFVAAGPAFKPGTMVPAFDNVDVYPLLMRLLGIEPLASDGSAQTFEKALQSGQ